MLFFCSIESLLDPVILKELIPEINTKMLGTMPNWKGADPPKDMPKNIGTLYMMKSLKTMIPKVQGVSISNGLEWSLDGKMMYYIDSIPRKVLAFDFNSSDGSITNQRVVFDFEAKGVQGFPDGMTICDKGHLWVACFGGSQVCFVYKSLRLFTLCLHFSLNFRFWSLIQVLEITIPFLLMVWLKISPL